MKTLKVLTSACRYCRYYNLEGRRGGTCQMLGVQVQGSWKACHAAIPAFAPAWESLERMILPDEKPVTLDNSQLAAIEQTANSTPEWKKAKALLV